MSLKYAWATVRRDELLTELDELRKEIDFLLNIQLTGVNRRV